MFDGENFLQVKSRYSEIRILRVIHEICHVWKNRFENLAFLIGSAVSFETIHAVSSF